MKDLAEHRWYTRIDEWVRRRGALTIVFFAFTPLPFFDVVGFAAGSLKYPLKRFVFFCLVGKIIQVLHSFGSGGLGGLIPRGPNLSIPGRQ